MRETKHTPGPWEVAPNSSVVFAVNETERDEAGRRVAVAQCGSEIKPAAGLKYGAERDANARLIAAAPDLLEALKAVVAIADRKTVEFDQAHAAIAKATEAAREATEGAVSA